MQQYPIRFYGRTLLFWLGSVFFGPIVVFLFTMSVLAILGMIPMDAQPIPEDVPPEAVGVINIIISLFFMLPLVLASFFQVFARQTPVLKIYREGMIIRTIGVPIFLDSDNPHLKVALGTGGGIIIIPLIILWQCITFQAFQIRTIRLRWENVEVVSETRILRINGLTDVDMNNGFEQDTTPKYHTVSYETHSFGVAIDKVIESVESFLHNPDSREMLPSWQDDDIVSDRFTMYND